MTGAQGFGGLGIRSSGFGGLRFTCLGLFTVPAAEARC